MSMDSVDDIEYAEGLLAAAGLIDDDYCRPTCQAEGDPDECGEGDCCGCPATTDRTTGRAPEPVSLPEKIAAITAALADDDGDPGENAEQAIVLLRQVAGELAALRAFIMSDGQSAADDCEQTYAMLGRLGYKVS